MTSEPINDPRVQGFLDAIKFWFGWRPTEIKLRDGGGAGSEDKTQPLSSPDAPGAAR